VLRTGFLSAFRSATRNPPKAKAQPLKMLDLRSTILTGFDVGKIVKAYIR
jgi:hypothetical protein